MLPEFAASVGGLSFGSEEFFHNSTLDFLSFGLVGGRMREAAK
jgi:hypothetical protein